jgi:hypothetical protein
MNVLDFIHLDAKSYPDTWSGNCPRSPFFGHVKRGTMAMLCD